MLPAVVYVDLPADAAAADAQVFFEACSDAYPAGDCASKADIDDAPLRAEVNWLNETGAAVTVIYVVDTSEHSSYRSLDFRAADDSAERYRTLGFAVGSMAGSLAVAEEKSAQQAGKAEPEPSAPDPTAAAPTTSKSAEPKSNDGAETNPPPSPAAVPYDPPDPLPSIPAGPPPPFEHLYRVGVHAGSGIGATRWGGSAGARVAWSRRWMIDLGVGYSVQSTNPDGVDTSFLSAALSVGLELGSGPFVLGLGVGPAWQQLWAERSDASKSAADHAWGGNVAAHLRYGSGVVCPFIELRGELYRSTRVELSEDRVVKFGPTQMQLSVGVTLVGNEL